MSRQLVPRTRNAGTMTEAMYFSKIRSLLRRGFMWWHPMQLALKAVERPSKSKNKKLKWEYKCAKCKKWFARKDVQIDHIVETGELNKYSDIAPFIERLTAEDINAYQVLCKAKCHKAKTEQYRKSKKK